MATYQTVVAGTTITASWGNNVRDGIVNTFGSASARTSAVSSPSESLLSYLSDKHRFEGYDGTQWQPVPFSSAVVKGVDQTLANSIALGNDSELLLPVSPNATYQLEMVLHYFAPVPGGLKFGFTFPTGASLTFGENGYVIGGTFTINRATNVGATSGVSTLAVEGAAANVVNATVSGTLITSSTAGNLQLQWAQNTTSGSSTGIKAGSLMRLTRIS